LGPDGGKKRLEPDYKKQKQCNSVESLRQIERKVEKAKSETNIV
jgi:hypothetical protein